MKRVIDACCIAAKTTINGKENMIK